MGMVKTIASILAIIAIQAAHVTQAHQVVDDTNTSSLEVHPVELFHPDGAAAFKVGLAKVAANSNSKRRANVFGRVLEQQGGHQGNGKSKRDHRKERRQSFIDSLLGDDSTSNDDNQGISSIDLNNALGLSPNDDGNNDGTITSGSIRTTETVPITYTTTIAGDRSEYI